MALPNATRCGVRHVVADPVVPIRDASSGVEDDRVHHPFAARPVRRVSGVDSVGTDLQVLPRQESRKLPAHPEAGGDRLVGDRFAVRGPRRLLGTAWHGPIVGLRGEGPHRAPPLRSRVPTAPVHVTPRRCATAAASTLLLTPSLRRMFETWTLAVFSDTNSASPICRFVWPAATRERTSASRGVRPS